MRPARVFGFAGLTALLLATGVVVVTGVSCSSTPSPVPIRTFERPQKMAVVCLGVNSADGAPAPVVTPLPLADCPPVPPTVIGSPFQNHVMVLVTQRTRGQLAVVDLTGGQVVDEDRSTPGINLIPVGADPTDVVVTPDLFLVEGDTAVPPLVFVASAPTNQPAIYSIPSSKLLGDSMGLDAQPPELTSFAACSLPQPPQALGVAITTSGGDAGGPAYVVVVLLRAFLGAPAQIVAVDPRPFSTTIEPGTLPPCTILGQAAFSGAVPATGPASAWPDGVVYADAGDLQANEPPLGPSCSSPPVSVGDAMATTAAGGDSGALEAGVTDAGPMAEEAASNDSGAPDAAGATPGGGDAGPAVGAGQAAVGAGLVLPPVGPPQPTAMVLRDDAPIAYVADESVPLIHIIDLSDPASPREIGQFVATSVANPSRQVQVGGLALSPRRAIFVATSTPST